jgi:hypothetical protein
MISARAKQAINHIFTRAAQTNLRLGSDDSVDISHLPESSLIEPPAAHLVVLTIVSYRFRLLTLFHVNDDRASRDYFGRNDLEKPIFDSFGETGNMCCGAMNRELGRHYPHLGMSTPYVLDSHCIRFISSLKPGYLSQHQIVINGSLTLHATLCLCTYGEMDFEAEFIDTPEPTGSLELF